MVVLELVEPVVVVAAEISFDDIVGVLIEVDTLVVEELVEVDVGSISTGRLVWSVGISSSEAIPSSKRSSKLK